MSAAEPLLLLLVRHGQTDWNRDARFRGRSDIPLNGDGVREAEALARLIHGRHAPQAVLASPLSRARSTASAIAHLSGLEVQAEDRLLDLDHGTFSGLTEAEAQARFPAEYMEWIQRGRLSAPPKGESVADLISRAGELVGELTEMHAGEQVVLVTHREVIRAVVCGRLGLPETVFHRIRIDTGSLTILDISEGGATLEKLNLTGADAQDLTDGFYVAP